MFNNVQDDFKILVDNDMTMTGITTQNIIRKLLCGDNFHTETLEFVYEDYLANLVSLFTKVVINKFNKRSIPNNLYEQVVFNNNLSRDRTSTGTKFETQMMNNNYKELARENELNNLGSYQNSLYEALRVLTQKIDISLTVKFRSVSVDLNVNDSLIIINSIAAIASQLQTEAWGIAEKQVEIPLMVTLCKLFSVPQTNYSTKGLTTEGREVDFHLIDARGKPIFCEVKLMGRGNPESADGVIARDTKLFIADKLSDLNKIQLTQRGVSWVELRSDNGYRKFLDILQELDIPCSDFQGDVNIKLDTIFQEMFE